MSLRRHHLAVLLAHRAMVLLWAIFLAGLPAVACADPPDPSWIGGYWDDDDFDGAVAFIASTCATVAKNDVDAKPCLVSQQSTDPAIVDFVTAPFSDDSRPRAPPVATLPLY